MDSYGPCLCFARTNSLSLRVDTVRGCPLDGENTRLDLFEADRLCDCEGMTDSAHLAHWGHHRNIADLAELFREHTNAGSIYAVVVGYEYVENGDLPPFCG